MKSIFILMLLVALPMVMNAQEDVYAIPDQYIVQLKAGIEGKEFFSRYPDTRVLKCLSKSMNIWQIRSVRKDMLSVLRESSAVKVAQHNHGIVLLRQLVPNDSLFNLQWNMLNQSHPGADISATEAWQYSHSNVTTLGDSIVIAVIDGGGSDPADTPYGGSQPSGFDLSQPDIHFFINHHEIPNNHIDDDGNGYVDDYLGWNVFTNNDSVFNFGSGDIHPTHVSGIAGAIGNNHIGVAGVCWGAAIMPIVGASNYESDVVNAYDYVLQMKKLYITTHGAKGAFVVSTNSSFGVGAYGANPADYPIWCAMYDSMGAYGILSAIAVPDAQQNIDVVNDVPTGCPSKYMIAVTNTTSSDNLNSGAAYGPHTVDIGAPGTSIVSCYPDDSYGYNTGTSMASPHLAGAVAALYGNACTSLMQACYAHPDSIALLMESYLYQSVDLIPSLHNITSTGGRLNLYHAFIAEDGYNCNGCNYELRDTLQNLVCYGDSSASIAISAGSDNSQYQFLWSGGETTASLTGLGAGYYQVTVTDTSGCQRQLSVLIVQPQPIVVSSITTNPVCTGCGGVGNIIVNAGTGAPYPAADFDSLYYALDSGSYQTEAVFATDSGYHTVYIKNQSGCVYDTVVYLESTVSIGSETETTNFIKLIPNPISGPGTLIISSSASFPGTLNVCDMTGRALSERTIRVVTGVQYEPMDLSMLAGGLYFITLARDGGTLAQIRVTVIK